MGLTTVKELFGRISRKMNELRLLEQGRQTYNEYIQIFKKVARESRYIGRPLVEEFK